jgi:hypothetical protein
MAKQNKEMDEAQKKEQVFNLSKAMYEESDPELKEIEDERVILTSQHNELTVKIQELNAKKKIVLFKKLNEIKDLLK